MTKEQMIDNLKYQNEKFFGGQSETLNETIKALEQATTKDCLAVDCVSRVEVLNELNRLGRNAFKDDTDYDNLFDFVDGLPPVTSTKCIATIQFLKRRKHGRNRTINS